MAVINCSYAEGNIFQKRLRWYGEETPVESWHVHIHLISAGTYIGSDFVMRVLLESKLLAPDYQSSTIASNYWVSLAKAIKKCWRHFTLELLVMDAYIFWAIRTKGSYCSDHESVHPCKSFDCFILTVELDEEATEPTWKPIFLCRTQSKVMCLKSWNLPWENFWFNDPISYFQISALSFLMSAVIRNRKLRFALSCLN